MNYIELLNRFYDLLQENHVSNNAQLLYYTLLQINNRCSWAEWFQRTNVSLSGMMCISEKALMNARNELKQLGLIDFVTSKKRGTCTKYTILYITKEGTKEVQEKDKGRTEEEQTSDINKYKQKQKKNIPNGISEKISQQVEWVVKLYNSTCMSLPKVTRISKARKRAIKTRLNEYDLEDFRQLFETAEKSDFLKGQNKDGWKANFDWLIKDANMAKVLDGNYVSQPEGKICRQPVRPNQFNNFDQRTYDYDNLEQQFMNQRMQKFTQTL